MSELRWNPVLREWIVTATHRQTRTFLPPAEHCPLCPARPGKPDTEIPRTDFDIVVFENRFPSLQRNPPPPAVESTPLCPVRPAQGVCEVVVYTPQHEGSLASQPLERIRRLIEVWADRYAELGARPEIRYVLIFENRGEIIGVTLHHPHGQIYAYPFIPPIPQRELDSAAEHHRRTGNCLFCDLLAQERADGRRMILENRHFSAFVPFYARWPYEVHIYPRAHRPSLPDLTNEERWDLARILKRMLTAYDALWGFPMPYMMWMHQQPTDGQEHPYHFHIEICPPLRTADKKKYRASNESGAGLFINDTLPEEKAEELRAALGRGNEPSDYPLDAN